MIPDSLDIRTAGCSLYDKCSSSLIDLTFIYDIIKKFHLFLDDSDPVQSVNYFYDIVNSLRNLEPFINNLNLELISELIIDLLDFSIMFEDNKDILLNSLNSLFYLISKSSYLRNVFVVECGAQRVYDILKFHMDSDILVVSYNILRIILHDKRTQKILDTYDFYNIIETTVRDSDSIDILRSLSSVLGLCLNFLTRFSFSYSLLALALLCETLVFDSVVYHGKIIDIQESLLIGLQNFALKSIDNCMWLFANHVVQLYFEKFFNKTSDEFTLLFFQFLNGIYGYVISMKLDGDVIVEDTSEIDSQLIDSTNEVNMEKLKELFLYCTKNHHIILMDKIFSSVTNLLTELVRYNKESTSSIIDLDLLGIILDKFKNGSVKLKRSVLHFIFELLPSLNTEFVRSKFLNEEFLTSIKFFMNSGDDECSISQYILETLLNIAPQGLQELEIMDDV